MARRESLMGRMEVEGAIVPSLLDRLTQDEDDLQRRPTRLSQPTRSFETEKARYIQSVNRDLEMLLNSRRTIIDVPEEFEQLRDSVFTYGLPDVSGIAVNTPTGRERLKHSLAAAIERHEPRLMNVRVHEIAQEGAVFELRFTIEAILCLDIGTIEVSFDTVMQPGSGTYQVVETDSGSLR
ncbi:MAG TPA: type VI secretion system baseplate subunit TssE [Gemmatimonadaceae bacterium]|jgi:type VI secretion system protein ImpF